jgi:hypothetical protein
MNTTEKFTKSVRSPATMREANDPIAFVNALFESRTLRTAVEQARERGYNTPVYRDGMHYSVLNATWTDAGPVPETEFVGGKMWSMADEKIARRNAYKALKAWGFLVDEVETSDGPCCVARAWFSLAAEEVVTLALTLVRQTRSASRALDHAAWAWLGYSRRDVSMALYDAHSRGLCEIYESGSIVELRFRDENGAFFDAVA